MGLGLGCVAADLVVVSGVNEFALGRAERGGHLLRAEAAAHQLAKVAESRANDHDVGAAVERSVRGRERADKGRRRRWEAEVAGAHRPIALIDGDLRGACVLAPRQQGDGGRQRGAPHRGQVLPRVGSLPTRGRLALERSNCSEKLRIVGGPHLRPLSPSDSARSSLWRADEPRRGAARGPA